MSGRWKRLTTRRSDRRDNATLDERYSLLGQLARGGQVRARLAPVRRPTDSMVGPPRA